VLVIFRSALIFLPSVLVVFRSVLIFLQRVLAVFRSVPGFLPSVLIFSSNVEGKRKSWVTTDTSILIGTTRLRQPEKTDAKEEVH
jgi:hypothetical protein